MIDLLKRKKVRGIVINPDLSVEKIRREFLMPGQDVEFKILSNHKLYLLLVKYRQNFERMLYQMLDLFWRDFNCESKNDDDIKYSFFLQIYELQSEFINLLLKDLIIQFKNGKTEAVKKEIEKYLSEDGESLYSIYSHLRKVFHNYSFFLADREKFLHNIKREKLNQENRFAENKAKCELVFGLIEYYQRFGKNNNWGKGLQTKACKIALVPSQSIYTNWKKRNSENMDKIRKGFTDDKFRTFYKRWEKFLKKYNISLKLPDQLKEV